MTLPAIVAKLLDLANGGPPVAQILCDALAVRATRVSHGDEQLNYPAWAKGTHGKTDTFLDCAGDVAGIAVWDDSRGWGAYAEFRSRPRR